MKLRFGVLGATSAALLVMACIGSPSPSPSSDRPAPSPTLLPPPVAISSPAPEVILSPIATTSPVALATPISAPTSPPSAPASAERVTVVNTEGQGANMRAEPAASATLLRTIREGTELEIAGPDREAGGRRWRNVRAPDGSSIGWIVADLLAAAPGEAAQAPNQPPASGASPVARAPASPPVPRTAASPAAVSAGASSTSTGTAASTQRIDDADRAYLNAIQPHVEAIGTAIGAANEQVAAASGRSAAVEDPAWRRATQSAARQFTDAAAGLRAAQPGPNTGGVQTYVVRAADRADEAAALLTTAVDSRDPRSLASVNTALVRVLAEINNMNQVLVGLQS